MKRAPLHVIVTTIQPPTAAMKKLSHAVRNCGGRLLVVGDRKGPSEYPLAGSELLTIEQQLKLPFTLPKKLPVNHYVRKNAGYLVAISRGAPCIYETDDDNAPNSVWMPRARSANAIPIRYSGWANTYAWFSREYIWPRGFPLQEIASSRQWKPSGRDKARSVPCPVQQGLADANPDVDAVWRLVLMAPVRFKPNRSLALQRGAWCPFNSQSTWWWPEAYPLLYLPSYCTFRMTDIWRSFIAQRCLWEFGGALAFHAPEVVQDRNVHNLLRDFQDEVPGYLNNARICEILGRLRLKPGKKAVTGNMRRCYEALVKQGVFPAKELGLLEAWLKDLETVRKR